MPTSRYKVLPKEGKVVEIPEKEEVKRFDNPHKYYVDLSQRLWDVKHGLLEKNG